MVSDKAHTCRIIVIDDNQAIHDDFSSILRSPKGDNLSSLESELFGQQNNAVNTREFHLEHALQGQEGWEKVREAKAENRPYSVAFVDMRMPPGWDGLETIEHLVAADPQLQIVICTAFSDHSWHDIQERLGDTDSLLILKKPADGIEIRQLAHALAGKWELERQKEQRMAELDDLVRERTMALEAANQRLRSEVRERDRVEADLRATYEKALAGINRVTSIVETMNELANSEAEDSQVHSLDEAADNGM